MEHRLKRALTTPFILLAAFVLWFWEWLWEPLQGAMARLARWPLLRQVDAWVAGAPRYVALALFLLPGAALLPFKLAGLYFLAHGAPLLGVLTFMAAKIVGTALLARIFTLTKPQLLTIGWFARSYAAVTRFTREFDGVDSASFRVPADELAAALARVPADVRTALEVAAGRIEAYHRTQIHPPTAAPLVGPPPGAHRPGQADRAGPVVGGRDQGMPGGFGLLEYAGLGFSEPWLISE